MSSTANYAGMFVENFKQARTQSNGLIGYMTLRLPALRMDIRNISVRETTAHEYRIELPYRLKPKTDGAAIKIYTIRFFTADDWKLFEQKAVAAYKRYIAK